MKHNPDPHTSAARQSARPATTGAHAAPLGHATARATRLRPLALAAGLLMCLASPRAAAQFAGGIGSAEDPFQITNQQQLEAVNNHLGKHFILVNDLDLAGTTYTRAVIAPFYLDSPEFTGAFDGNGKVIRNLKIEGGGKRLISLFGQIGSDGSVSGLGLENVDISSFATVGGLAGFNRGTIRDSHATGNVSGEDYVGGLAGVNSGTIRDSHATGNVSGTGRVGGLVGDNTYAFIMSSHFSGDVNGSFEVGGLVGSNYGSIAASHATGDVSGHSAVGGLAGWHGYGSITASYATGDVGGHFFVGGLVGLNDSVITRCHSTGPVTGDDHVGGLVGQNRRAAITRSYSSGLVAGVSNVGGLVGSAETGPYYADEGNFWDKEASGQPTNSAMGEGKTTAQMRMQATFTGAGWDFVGEDVNGIHDFWSMPAGGGYPELYRFSAGYVPRSLAGAGTSANPFQVSNARDLAAVSQRPDASYRLMNDIDLEGIPFRDVAVIWMPFGGHFDGNGFAIRNPLITGHGSIIGVFSTIATEGTVARLEVADAVINGLNSVGGLAGFNRGTITGCNHIGAIHGNEDIGGLVGWNSGSIAASHAAGNVSGFWYVGGLVGWNPGSIAASYATATAGGELFVGGLVGYHYGSVVDSYASGSVGGVSHVGGLVGKISGSRGTLTRCHSVGAVSGTSDVGGLVGSVGGGTSENNFWDTDTSGQSVSAMGEGKTTAEMRVQATFTNWDFPTVWHMPMAGYPKLAWQIQFTAGDGSASDPFHILTQEQLEAVNDHLDRHFILMNDLDLADTAYPRAVIAPYLDASSPRFTGSFDGNGKVIRNLRIEGGGNDNLGLFGRIGTGGAVTSLALEGVSVSGLWNIGALAGVNNGTLAHCRATGTVAGNSYVGGLVGDNPGGIARCFSLVAVSANNYVGGLVGENSGTLADCYARGPVSGLTHVGGLAGRHAAMEANRLVRCYATGAVSGSSNIGGLVGSKALAHDPLNSFWDMDTTLQTTSAMGQGKPTSAMFLQSTYAGAGWDFATSWRMPAAGYPKLAWQAGFTEGTGEESDPYRIFTQDQLEAVNDDLAAHYRLMNDLDLVGAYPRAVIAPYLDGNSPSFTGSFDGNNRTIRNLMIHDAALSHAGLFGRVGAGGEVRRLNLDASISAGTLSGGFAGVNDGTLADCRVEGSVIGAGDYTGGLVGWNNGPVQRCHGAALVHGAGRVGGLLGLNTGQVTRCQARREVSGASFVGGLAGQNTGTLSESFARGDVTATGDLAGGLAGANSEGGTLTNCYARGAVAGARHVGGLLGRNTQSAVVRCFSTGTVAGTGDLGGLAGSVLTGGAYADTANHWDSEASGRGTSAMGAPRNSDAMKTQGTFVGWNFEFFWGLDNDRNDGYPHLRQNLPARVARPSFSPRGGMVGGGMMMADVTLWCLTPNAWIHYTTDGRDPTTFDPSQTAGGSALVTLPATLKARAYLPGSGLDPSPVHEAFFDGATANGIWFSWLLRHGYPLTGTDDFEVPPGKTQDVLTHFLADLDPGDPASVLRVLGIERGADVTVEFTPCSPDREYRLEYSVDLAAGSWQALPGIAGMWRPGYLLNAVLRDPAPAGPRRFYRVAVRLPGTGGEPPLE
jgi:hypothetical protein